jgi:hypothetical protein
VRYVYQVSRKEFTNDSIRPKRIPLPRHNTKESAQKMAESFPDDVTVIYNPEDPGESFLVQTSRAMLYIVCGASCLAILLVSTGFFAEVNQAITLDHYVLRT